MAQVITNKHTVVDVVNVVLTPDEAKELYGLLASVSINYVSDTFDKIAYEIDREFDFKLAPFQQDENGEFGPYNYAAEDAEADCGCGLEDDEDEVVEDEYIG